MAIVQLGIRYHDVTNWPLWSRLSINIVMFIIIWTIKHISIDLFALHQKAFHNANFCKAFQWCHSYMRRSQPLPDPDPLPEEHWHFTWHSRNADISTLSCQPGKAHFVSTFGLKNRTHISKSCRRSAVVGCFTWVQTVMKGNLHITHLHNTRTSMIHSAYFSV